VRVPGDSIRHGAPLSRHLTDAAGFVPLQPCILARVVAREITRTEAR
jgi:hypothetical protein